MSWSNETIYSIDDKTKPKLLDYPQDFELVKVLGSADNTDLPTVLPV